MAEQKHGKDPDSPGPGRRILNWLVDFLDNSGLYVWFLCIALAFFTIEIVAPGPMAALALAATISMAINFYAAEIYDGTMDPIGEETNDLPRAKILFEVINKLLAVSLKLLPGAFLMAAYIWLMLKGLDIAGITPQTPGTGPDIALLFKAAGLALGICLACFTLDAVLSAALFYALLRIRGWDPQEFDLRCRKLMELKFGLAAAQLTRDHQSKT